MGGNRENVTWRVRAEPLVGRRVSNRRKARLVAWLKACAPPEIRHELWGRHELFDRCGRRREVSGVRSAA
jgi:hypothetical protein